MSCSGLWCWRAGWLSPRQSAPLPGRQTAHCAGAHTARRRGPEWFPRLVARPSLIDIGEAIVACRGVAALNITVGEIDVERDVAAAALGGAEVLEFGRLAGGVG